MCSRLGFSTESISVLGVIQLWTNFYFFFRGQFFQEVNEQHVHTADDVSYLAEKYPDVPETSSRVPRVIMFSGTHFFLVPFEDRIINSLGSSGYVRPFVKARSYLTYFVSKITNTRFATKRITFTADYRICTIYHVRYNAVR